MMHEAPRIARKPGQRRNSPSHSDLYTDENPKGTIKGLCFKDVETAKASVAKIKSSGKTHAHKIQAAIAMEQRARVMGKSAEAAVYRKYINAMKKKTKKMQKESLWANIHKRRKSGKRMRKKGEKGAPSPEAMARAKATSEDMAERLVTDKKLKNLRISNKPSAAGDSLARSKKRQAAKRGTSLAAQKSCGEDASAMTTTANIPNPATTAMGPTPFLDKRRKKEKSVMLKRFKKYFEDKGVF